MHLLDRLGLLEAEHLDVEERRIGESELPYLDRAESDRIEEERALIRSLRLRGTERHETGTVYCPETEPRFAFSSSIRTAVASTQLRRSSGSVLASGSSMMAGSGNTPRSIVLSRADLCLDGRRLTDRQVNPRSELPVGSPPRTRTTRDARARPG